MAPAGGSGLEIRAVAFHAPIPNKGSTPRTYVEKLLFEESDILVKELRSSVGPVRTRRLILPFLEDLQATFGGGLERIVDAAYSLAADEKYVDYVAVPLKNIGTEAEKIPEVFLSYENIFFSVRYKYDKSEEIARLLRKIPEVSGWVMAAHFGVAFGNHLATPYFPVTASRGEGFSVSLLYPKFLENKLKDDEPLAEALSVLSNVNSRIQEICKRLSRIPVFFGVDYSLSPWMDQSVARVLEIIKKAPLPLPGTHAAIRKVNLELVKLASSSRGVGYNEVMLPLAEDDRLKELALMEEIGLSDFLSYVSVCVAGLDMVALPIWTDDKILVGIMKDLEAFAGMKGRGIGLRLLLVHAEPGEEVDLGLFEKTPVIDPLS